MSEDYEEFGISGQSEPFGTDEGNTMVAVKKNDVVPEEEEETDNDSTNPYHVIVKNDDFHSVEYVIEMMLSLFGHPAEKGLEIAKKIHFEGQCVVATTHKEKAEMHQEQIHAFGADPLIPACEGPMTAIIEPA